MQHIDRICDARYNDWGEEIHRRKGAMYLVGVVVPVAAVLMTCLLQRAIGLPEPSEDPESAWVEG